MVGMTSTPGPSPPAGEPEIPRVVFVIGTGRCGSTLVHEVLARHRDMGFVTHLEDRLGRLPLNGRFSAGIYRHLPRSLSSKGMARIYPSEGYRALDAQVSPILSSPGRDLLAHDATPWLAGRTRSFFERHAQGQKRPVLLHKFTGWPRARFLAAVFEQARFVHVVRDGRAVANSWLQMPWWRGWAGPEGWGFGPLAEDETRLWHESDRNFAVLAGLQWQVLIRAFEQSQRELGPQRWLELRFEDLLDQPRESFEKILGLCGSQWDAGFERAFGRYAFDPGRATAFRRDLDGLTIKRIETAIGPALQRHGYATG
jgi:Sulfotransferase family